MSAVPALDELPERFALARGRVRCMQTRSIRCENGVRWVGGGIAQALRGSQMQRDPLPEPPLVRTSLCRRLTQAEQGARRPFAFLMLRNHRQHVFEPEAVQIVEPIGVEEVVVAYAFAKRYPAASGTIGRLHHPLRGTLVGFRQKAHMRFVCIGTSDNGRLGLGGG